MPFDDLRQWMQAVDSLGELRRVEGADWDLEIGIIADLYQREIGKPALLFEKIPGCPEGFRLLANPTTSLRRIALSLELPTPENTMDLVRGWRGQLKQLPTLEPRVVPSGPVLENVLTGDKIDITTFPSPRWHEGDGGRYIGTGCLVVTRDPDGGWVNYGTYRVMVQDARRAGLYMSPGKQGRQMLEAYWARGEAMPVAVVCGQDPLLYMLSGMEVPHGVNELAVAGGVRGKPVDVIHAPATGLPVPATAEIVLEGFIKPGDVLPEGPFGEWTGYYATGTRPEPVIAIESVLHRHAPIMLGSQPGVPPTDTIFYRCPMRSAIIWDQLEKAGINGVQGVWTHEAGGGRLMVVVSLQQKYAGHSTQAGFVAANCHGGAYANRMTVVVDEDIDPTNTNDVIWAICTRCNPTEDVQFIRNAWSTGLDPMAYPADRRNLNSRMVIDACIPWNRKKDFPAVARCSPEAAARIKAKFPQLF